MRVRTFGNAVGPRYVMSVRDLNPGRSSTESPTSESFVGTKIRIEDVNTPRYLDVISGGGLVLNPVYMVRETRSAIENPVVSTGPIGPYKSERIFSGDFAGYFQHGLPNPLDISESLSRAQQVSLVKAYADMNKSAVMLPESLLELGKTVQTFKRPMGALRDVIKRMYRSRDRMLSRKRGLHTVHDLQTALAGAWLEHRYAIMPQLLDINTVADACVKARLKCELPRKAARGTGNSGSVTKSWEGTCWTRISDMEDPKVAVYWSKDYRSSSGVIYEVKNQTMPEKLAKFTGMTLSDVPSTLYNLTPLSFVADWFTNVGDWILAITPNPYVRVLGSWTTSIINESTNIATVRWDTWLGWMAWQKVSLSAPGSSYQKFTYVRETNPSVASYPSLTKIPLSLTHSVDGAALAAQMLSGSIKNLLSGGKAH